MPNVLLFGCDRELVERFASDPRWTVAIATHCSDGDPTYGLPSPMEWQLIVDDCLHPGFPMSMLGNQT